MHQQHLVALGFAWGTLALATCAAAQVPFTEKQVQLSVGLSYGVYLGNTTEDIPTPYGLGLAAKGGFTFDPSVYLGGELNYFFGATRRFPEYGDVEGSLSVLHYGAEAGYDVGLGRSLVLRPKFGIGSATVTAEATVEDVTDDISQSGLAATVGVQALGGGETWFLTVEARYTYLSVSTEQLQQIPGMAVDGDAQLDGLLLSVGVGIAF
ncbi:outer membrane beta-barrel protein [Myxococcota bacterium]